VKVRRKPFPDIRNRTNTISLFVPVLSLGFDGRRGLRGMGVAPAL
jgi:hypothetical protein